MDIEKANNDQLKNLFLQIKPEDPSSDFTDHLMSRIMEEEKVASKKKLLTARIIKIALIISGSVIVAFSLSFIFNYLLEIFEVPFPDFKNIFTGITFDKNIIISGSIVLFLLIGDLFLKKSRKNYNQNY